MTEANMEDYLRRAKTMLVSFSLNSPGIIRVLLVGMMTTVCIPVAENVVSCFFAPQAEVVGYGGRPE